MTALRELVTSEFDRLQATTKQQQEAYAREREDLVAERTKLLQAHYAGAVPLELLKTEQERIAKRLSFLEAQIEAGTLEYEQAQAHLEDCLALAGDCHAIYLSIDDSLRRKQGGGDQGGVQTANVAGLNKDHMVRSPASQAPAPQSPRKCWSKLRTSLGSIGAPDRIRTCDTRFRRAVLYPLSYGGEKHNDDDVGVVGYAPQY